MKRITLSAFALAALVTLCGVSGLAETKSDYDHHYRLVAGSTWGFQPQQSAAKDVFGKNSLWDQRVRDDLSMELRSAGLKQTVNGAPDLLVSYHLSTQQSHTTEVFNSGYPGYYGHYGFGRFGYRRGWIGWGPGWGPDWGPTTVVRIPQTRNTLVMDVYDGRTKQLVWRGYDTKTIDYNKADKSINDAVAHLTKRFEHDLKLPHTEG
ncbi:MAG: DUF4136 domain-containing protein [Acidobacteria bacterium]|nr:DUF4136 domain-containing protein [Acidobacteriota bacterium]MBI3425905.1 DUF4136 domain-containing protein [Acidobacteriota bacterium]